MPPLPSWVSTACSPTSVTWPASRRSAPTVVERHGAAHLLCNNAGVGGGGRLDSQTMKDWEWVVGVNLWGVVHGIQVFLPHLQANADGGHIVNTASMAGLAPFPGIGVYNATKYAVVGISETLAIELAGSGVGVSVLCPGVVNTNIFKSQRNRPEHLRNPARNVAARAANDEMITQVGIDPSEVADKVAHAVRDGRVLDHHPPRPADARGRPPPGVDAPRPRSLIVAANRSAAARRAGLGRAW